MLAFVGKPRQGENNLAYWAKKSVLNTDTDYGEREG